MRSIVLVILQFALIGAMAVPWAAPEWNGIANALLAAGMALGLWTLAANRPGNFNVRPDPKPGGHLVVDGPYRFIRHPMYAAVLLFAAGLCVGYGTLWRWVALAILGAVLYVKARIEEQAMTQMHPGYAAYARRTKRIVPFVW